MDRRALLAALAAPALGTARAQAPAGLAIVHPPGLPAIGKWMIDADGSPAHWLGEIVNGKALREPINLVLIDAAAASEADALRRALAAMADAGYPVRFGHSAGYRGYVGALYPQLPTGRDDAFSNGIFELTNNHGRLFGPHAMAGGFAMIGAFSREAIRIGWPPHGYSSFIAAREDVAERLARATGYRRDGYAFLDNALADDPKVGTGDHDGRAAVLRAG